METIQLKAHVNGDGTLMLELPSYLSNKEVTVTIQVEDDSDEWPPHFFEETYGLFRDNPIEREPQSEI